MMLVCFFASEYRPMTLQDFRKGGGGGRGAFAQFVGMDATFSPYI